MFGVVRELAFLLDALFDGLEGRVFDDFFEQTRVQLGDYVFGGFFVGIEVGGVGPAD